MSEGNDPTSNYRGYVISYTKGAVHIDPATGEAHRDDHICNQQCWELKARAKAEYWEDVEKSGGYLSKPQKTTDDIVDVSGESSIRRFIEDHKDPGEALRSSDDIVVSGGWVGPSDEVLAEWDRNKKDLENSSLDDDDDISTPANAEEARLITAMADELMKRSINITPGSCMYFAGYLAARVVKEGWVCDD